MSSFPLSSSPAQDMPGQEDSSSLLLVPAIAVLVVCVVLIIVAGVVLALLLMKSKRRVVVIRGPNIDNPHYNHLTIRSEPAATSNVFKRLSLRIINRFSVYSQGDSNTLTRQSGTLTRNTATLSRNAPLPPSPKSPSPSTGNTVTEVESSPKLVASYFSFVDTPVITFGRDYETTTTPCSTTSAEQPIVAIIRKKEDSEDLETDDSASRPYSQLRIPTYSDTLEEGSVVPTEEERATSLCEHLVKPGHLYNKLQFFEQSDEFWLPSSTTSGLYTQLSIRKYREISKDQMKVDSHLGSGNFATVFQGRWLVHDRMLQVAIKILKAGSKVFDRIKFLQEAAIMGQFCHPNIVRLHGVVTLGEPTMIVSELLSKGDLLTYLNKLNPSPDPREQDPLQRLFVKFAREIASGMEHLSKKRFIHRDLAARNILLSEDLTCKIGDFGMARNLLDEDYYHSRGGKIPVKWTAPEALLYKKYSTDSDVWSYGILLYEIWSLGKKPFPDITMNDMINEAATGLCHSPCPGLSRAIYILMVDCWNPQHSKRPSFDKIQGYLSQSESILLHWSEKDLSVSPLVHVLGASLTESKGLYKDLQYFYCGQNDKAGFTKTRGTSEKHTKNKSVMLLGARQSSSL